MSSISFSNVEIERDAMRLTRDGLDIPVEPQVFELLILLAENADRVVTKDEIIERVWQGRFVSDGAITSRINAARKAVGDNGKAQRVIRTIPMRGYRFVAEIDQERTTHDLHQNNCTIAVMPFRNLSNDPDQKFFAEGMLEDLVMKLGRVRWMQVIASATTATYSAETSDPGATAKALNVRYLVTGSIRKSDNLVRVGAQLMDTENGWSLWAESFDRELDDIFKVQDEITASVVAMIENEIGSVEQADAERANPTKLEAWTLYHKGMSRLRNEAALQRNASFVPLFDEAIELDPEFALARAGRAFAEYWAFVEGQREADFNLAFDHAERAVTLDPREPFAHHALGALHCACRNHESSIAAFDRALELNPSFAWSMHIQASNFIYLGDAARATELIDTAIRLSPRDTLIGLFLAMKSIIGMCEGQYAEAVTWGRKAMAYPQPRWVHLYVLSALAHLEQWDEVEDVLTIISRLRPEFTLNYVDKTFPLLKGAAKERMLEGLRMAGLPPT